MAGCKHPGRHAGDVRWHGNQGGVVAVGQAKLRVQRPRLRNMRNGAGEVDVPAYAALRSEVRFRLKAEIPSLPEAKFQQAANQTVSGVRVRSKMVPAVTDGRLPQFVHMNLPSPSRHPPAWPHSGQTNPDGHRSHSR